MRALFLDRVVDLMDEGIDVAIRIGMLPDSSLSAVRVGSVRRVICAAPDYLKQRGVPRTPADLAQHDAIAFVGVTPLRDWSFMVDGKVHAATPRIRLEVNSADVAIAAAVGGGGLTRVLSYQAAQALRAQAPQARAVRVRDAAAADPYRACGGPPRAGEATRLRRLRRGPPAREEGAG